MGSEYIFLKSIINRLGKKGIFFDSEPITENTHCFISEDKTISITHDININNSKLFLKSENVFNEKIQRRPDIAIFKNKKLLIKNTLEVR